MSQYFARIMLAGLLSAVGSLAWAEVVVVTAGDSPVRELTSTQLADIYLGRLTRLPDGRPVVPIDQGEQSRVYEIFYQQYLGRSPAQIRSHWSRLIFTGRGQPPKSVANEAALAEALKQNLNAIGYMEADALPEGLRVIDIES